MQGRAQILDYEVSLLLGSPAHALEEELVDLPVSWFILSCQAPQADVVLLILLKKPRN